MGRLHWGQRTGDPAFASLVVGGVAIVLGGAALFGLVAHTWTPFLPLKGAGSSPFDAVARGAPAAPTKSAELPPPRRKHTVVAFDPRPDELNPVETEFSVAPEALSMLVKLEPVELHALAPAPIETAPPVLASETIVVEAPAIEAKVAPDPKPVVVRVADVRVVAGANGARRVATDVRLVESGPAEVKVAKAKPAPPARREPKVTVAKRVEPKPAPVKVAEAKRIERKPAPTRVAETRRLETKPALVKVSDTKRVEPKPVPSKAADSRRAEAKRVADAKAAEARAAEARAAEARLAEAKAADAKRVAEVKAAESRITEMKRVAEKMAAEASRAEAKRVADMKAADARLAEANRATELKIAEAKLIETQLAFETQAAETRIAEARRSVKPAVETRIVESKAVPAKPAFARYECETCGTVTSVVSRLRERGTPNWEVRVSFRDGTDRLFLYPTDPGLLSGDRVRVEAGRLMHQSPRRSASNS